MAEETEELQEAEASWDETPEYGADKQPVPVEGEEQQTEDAEVMEAVEEEVEAEPDTDWQDRYKNLEASHSRRGNEVFSLKKEKEDLRLEKLELQQKLQGAESSSKELNRLKEAESNKPDPYEDSKYFTEEELSIQKEYPEILAVAKKQAHREAAIALRGLDKSKETLLEKETSDLKSQVEELKGYIARQQAFNQLDQMVPDWRKADLDPKFIDYVNKSELFRNAMTDGSLEEKAEVFKTYLGSDQGQKLLSGTKASPAQPQDTRRQAAQGLVRGSARDNKPTGELSIDELWNATPEYNPAG